MTNHAQPMRLFVLVFLLCGSCAPVLDRVIPDNQGSPTVSIKSVANMDVKIVLVDGKPTASFLEKLFGRDGVNGVHVSPGQHDILVNYTLEGPLSPTASPRFCFVAEPDHEYNIKFSRHNYSTGFWIEDSITKRVIDEDSCMQETK